MQVAVWQSASSAELFGVSNSASGYSAWFGSVTGSDAQDALIDIIYADNGCGLFHTGGDLVH